MPLILFIKLLAIGVIFAGMSATWRYSSVSTTSGNGCRTGGSLSTSRRSRHVLKSEKDTQKPQREKIVVRNHLVYCGDYHESGLKEGAQICVCLPLRLMREVACLSETILCLIGSPLILCLTTRTLSGFVVCAHMPARWSWYSKGIWN
jgi:hypothetical protein